MMWNDVKCVVAEERAAFPQHRYGHESPFHYYLYVR